MRSLSLNRETILFFPKRYIIIYYTFSYEYTNIYYSKDPKPWKCRLRPPRPIEQRRGKLSLEFFLTSATPLTVVKLELVGGGWLWPGGVARSTATATATTTTSCSGFLMLTRPRKKVRERRIYFFSIHKEMKT